MQNFERVECTDCGCKLWSEYAKQIKLCPECENVDFDYSQDAEDLLEYAQEN